jgi:secondary thiamine-phosphate synthase enzyme
MKTSTSTIEVSAPSRDTYLDLTEDLQRAIKDSGVTEGMVVAFCAHTTCALLINEWEDGAQEDFRNLLHGLVPEDRYYAHDDLDRRTQNLAESHERRNGHAHAKAMLLSASSHAIPVVGGEPAFGRWQRLILFEMDEPKDRQVLFHVFGE